jgi:adenosine deaminase
MSSRPQSLPGLRNNQKKKLMTIDFDPQRLSHLSGARYEKFLRRMPKAELHSHFEGSIPAATVMELARKNGLTPPVETADLLYSYVPDRHKFLDQATAIPDWVRRALSQKYQRPMVSDEDMFRVGIYEAFLDRFDFACQSLTSADDYSRAIYSSLLEAANTSNVRYTEKFFHPMNNPAVPYRTILEGLVDGIRAAERDAKIVCRLIPAFNRDHSVAAANQFVDVVLSHRFDEVVGLGSDYDEEHLPGYAQAYRKAAEAGLPGTAHAGENGGPITVQECIDDLGIRRIDHGYRIVEDDELVQRAKSLGVHFTVIMSVTAMLYNSATDWPLPAATLDQPAKFKSPIRDMIDKGLSVSIASDDPVFYGMNSLSDEYIHSAYHMDLEASQIVKMDLEALQCSWADPDTKKRIRNEMLGEISVLADQIA